MAKNKISVDLEVDDKGSLKKVSNSADKASKSLDKVAKGSSTADRNIKGVAGASSNASKNFSKMSQGMGGLVGAYAALAAQTFAISAAFNFLKSAGDLKVLEASQQSYASNTGLAMKVLANDIVSATNATINFQDASQAAAIGTAAGLSPGQLKSLGKAASDLSVTLGRDVTDSFNRLVRGVTKAEPELLDELGIILRLKDAQEEYARTIGKSANELTQFEKSQAVANKVLQEASRVAALAPEGVVNPYNQLGKAFDDILIKAKLLADQIVGPLAKVLTDTPGLAIASFGLLLKGPLAAMGVSFKDMASQARLNAKEQVAAAVKAQEAYRATRLTIQSTTAAVREQAAAALAAGSQSKILQQFASGGIMTPQARATLKRALKAAEKNVNEHGIIIAGIFKGMDIKIVRDFQIAMKQLEVAEAGKVATTQRAAATISAAYATIAAVIARTSAFILTWGTRLLGAFGWFAIAVTGFQLLSNYMGWFKKDAEESADSLEPTRSRLADLNKEYEKFGETQEKLIKAGRSNEVFSNVATKSSMLSSDEFSSTLKMSKEYNKLLQKRNKIVRLAAANQDNMSRSTRREFNNALVRNKAELDTNKEAKKFIDDEINAINQVIRLTGMKPKFALDYLAVLNGTANATEQEAQAIRNTFQERGNLIKQSTRLIAEAEAASSDWVRSLAPLSQGDIGVRNIQLAIDNLNEQANSGIRITDEQLKSLRKLSATKKLMVAFEKEINAAKLASIALDTAQENQLRNLESSYNGIINVAYDILRAEAEITAKQNRIDNLTELTELSEEENNARNREIELLEQKIVLDKARLETTRQEGDYLGRILQTSREIKQIRLSSEVMSQAKEYLNILKTQVDLDKQSLDARIALSKIRMARQERRESTEPFAFLDKQERNAQNAYDLESGLLKSKIAQLTAEADMKRQMVSMEFVLLDAKLRVSELELRNRAEADGLREGEKETLLALASATEAQRQLSADTLGARLGIITEQQSVAIANAVEEVDKLKFANEQLSDTNVLLLDIQTNFASGFSEAFSSIIQGTASVKDAFRNMAMNVLKSLSDIISQMLVAKIIQSSLGFFGGGGPAINTSALSAGSGLGPTSTPGFTLPGITGAATGGVFSQGKKMSGYATGGIASGSKTGYPAVLHGTEAVVPLPNGRSIPVDMSGSVGQNNNVTVNVAIDSNGNASTNTEQSSAEAGNMGNLIAKAVQKELQNQKRSGGILSPYGVA